MAPRSVRKTYIPHAQQLTPEFRTLPDRLTQSGVGVEKVTEIGG